MDMDTELDIEKMPIDNDPEKIGELPLCSTMKQNDIIPTRKNIYHFL